MGNVDHNHGYETCTVDGSRSKYAIQSVSHVNKTLLCVRELSWFCKFCVDGGDGPCDNHSHVQPWDLLALEPCSPIDDRCDLETNDTWEVSHDGETLAACLEIGDYLFCH